MSALRTLQVRVKRGAEFLDTLIPGWAYRMKLNQLDLGDCQQCIIGQLYGQYWNHYTKVTGNSSKQDYRAEQLGINSDLSSQNGAIHTANKGQFSILTRLWTHQIRKRQSC